MTDKRPSISVVICAHNEEARLAACLEKVSFADEIVVLLDKCTDGSEAIARRFSARIVYGDWPTEGDRRIKPREASADDHRPPMAASRLNQGPGVFQVPEGHDTRKVCAR